MHLHSDQFLTGKTFKEKLGYYVAAKILEKLIALEPTHGFPCTDEYGVCDIWI